ncbi:bromodomain and WD repeat-containing protein 1-like [Selaginella moellendorffii]|uniref:bromodomain and WD repeat-containing protein 1-like n=1 Tax=Selaginella moellendorffii TaxID=88036 RepID=UPI000D1CA8EA|nr:bromodomain and WD repeat-containing protein 1-like [Selaginella moellendorffii]|eukprot:XP_024519817.1 bromodomain and WD repeat-containing protein 1-like [Selaginella moellendorffii]
MAAWNALTMFSSLHEYEDDGARRLAAEDAKRPGTSGENENQRLLRNGKVLTETQEREDDEPLKKSPAETSDVGKCRRPRSQRKLVLKLRNCAQTSNNEDTFQSLEIPEQGTSKVPVAEAIAHKSVILLSSLLFVKFILFRAAAAVIRHASTLGCFPLLPYVSLFVVRRNSFSGILVRDKTICFWMTVIESLQNGEAPDGDNDPDYHEEVSPGSNSESLEDAYKPEEEQASEDLDVDDIQMKRNMNKAVYSRRRPRKVATKTECYEADEHASGGRRRSTRLAQGRVVSLSNSRSTRSRRNVGRPSHWEASSSYDDSDWDRSSDDDGRRKPERRTSSRLKVKLQKNVGSRYKDFHVRRNLSTVHRSPSNVSWLLLTEVERTRYIPQYGDEVVYFRQGHQDYLDNKRLDDDGPWRSVKRELQVVEFCEITGLEYIILEVSGNTCCRLTLEFMDGYRIRGSSFSVDLPELTDFADFIVERSRYEASMARKWSSRDKCQVWWRSDEEEGGRWWEGTITQVKGKSPEFPNSPRDSISVLYKDEPSTTNHCPWELHDVENPLTWESPQIEQDKVRELLDIVDEVLHSNQSKDEYGLWRLQQAVSKPDFLDRIALPISMDVIRERLENNYYRSVA